MKRQPKSQRMEVLSLEWVYDKGYGRVRFRCKQGHEHWWRASYKLGRKLIPMGEAQFNMTCKRWINGGADGVCRQCESALSAA